MLPFLLCLLDVHFDLCQVHVRLTANRLRVRSGPTRRALEEAPTRSSASCSQLVFTHNSSTRPPLDLVTSCTNAPVATACSMSSYQHLPAAGTEYATLEAFKLAVYTTCCALISTSTITPFTDLLLLLRSAQPYLHGNRQLDHKRLRRLAVLATRRRPGTFLLAARIAYRARSTLPQSATSFRMIDTRSIRAGNGTWTLSTKPSRWRSFGRGFVSFPGILQMSRGTREKVSLEDTDGSASESPRLLRRKTQNVAKSRCT